MDWIKNFFETIKQLFTNFNGWMQNTFSFDEKILNFYNEVIAPMGELTKILGLIAVLLLVVIGTVVVLKKAYKLILSLIIVAIVVGAVIYFLSL